MYIRQRQTQGIVWQCVEGSPRKQTSRPKPVKHIDIESLPLIYSLGACCDGCCGCDYSWLFAIHIPT